MARRSAHDVVSLEAMEDKLALFHELREIFLDLQIRADFNLPRQHALVHYTRGIRLFGSPNGLCTSITESKHIDAVKEPWRKSSRNNPLPQILLENVRRSKLQAQHGDFGRRGMIDGHILVAALQEVGHPDAELVAARTRKSLLRVYTTASEHEAREDHDVMDMDGDEQPPSVWLAKRASTFNLYLRFHVSRLRTLQGILGPLTSSLYLTASATRSRSSFRDSCMTRPSQTMTDRPVMMSILKIALRSMGTSVYIAVRVRRSTHLVSSAGPAECTAR